VVTGVDELRAHHGRVRPPPLAVTLPRRHLHADLPHGSGRRLEFRARACTILFGLGSFVDHPWLLWCWAVSVTHITHGLWPPPWLAPCDLL
jgi:hypothetical protein